MHFYNKNYNTKFIRRWWTYLIKVVRVRTNFDSVGCLETGGWQRRFPFRREFHWIDVVLEIRQDD